MITSTNEVGLLGTAEQTRVLSVFGQSSHSPMQDVLFPLTLNSKQTKNLLLFADGRPSAFVSNFGQGNQRLSLQPTHFVGGGGLCMITFRVSNKALFLLCWMQLSCIKKILYLENKCLQANVTICQAF